jgi:hypothetical protein
MKKIILGVAAAALALSLSSCAKATEPFKDAPRSGTTNSDPADVIEMPDGFNNMATKCDHGNRVYSTYHADATYGSIAVAPHDPSCSGH